MIRLAQQTDLSAICLLRRQIHALHSNGRPDIYRMPENLADFDQILYEDFKKEDYRLFVYETDKINAYALVRLVTRMKDATSCDRFFYYINEFCVDDTCRRKGIGTMLMNAIIDDAKEKGAISVELGVWAFNESAELFYRSLGMQTKNTILELSLN